MNYGDFFRAIYYLKDASGKDFPGGVVPGLRGRTGTVGSNPATVFVSLDAVHIAENQATWEAYGWNPPEYRKRGAISTWYPWSRDSGPEKINEEPDPEVSQFNPNARVQFAYKVAPMKPQIPESPADEIYNFRWNLSPAPPGIPDGWTIAWPGEPCWMIRRWVSDVPEDLALPADPAAMKKPTWQELVDTVTLLDQQDEYYQLRREHDHETEADAVKRRITDKALLDVLGGLTYVGDGLDHMTGLLQMVEQATMAGAALPLIELRDENHNLKKYHLQSQLRKLLVRTSERENVVECCHNRVIKPIIDKWKAAEDETRKWPDRLDNMNDYADLVENYETLLKAEMERFDPDELPEDLPELREKYIEMLEGVATGHQQWVKGALTQQAIDNWAACVEVDQALQEISLECAAGSIAIANVRDRIWKKVSGKWEVANPRTGRVDHEGDDEPTADIGSEGEHYRQINTGQDIAKAAYEKAVQAIRAVSPINVPEITYAVSGRKVTIRAEHPDTDPPIRGQVTIDSSGIGSTDGSNIVGKINAVTVGPSRESDPIISRYEFADDYGGKIRIKLTARNVCGPAEIVLNLKVTANGAIAVEQS